MKGKLSMNQEKIGNFIREIRKKNNLTQKDLADKLGITYQAVSKWENGKNIPDIALLKEISKMFNVDINELLEGEVKTDKESSTRLSNKNFIWIILLLISVIVVVLVIYFNHDHGFEFKMLTSNCDEFDIVGSMAYNKDKTSIYISSVDYCGADSSKVYDKIECTLYEEHEGNKNVISSCDSSTGSVILSEFLDNVKISVDDYSASCKMYTSSDLYLEINASEGSKIITYKIPITINDNCLK